MIANDLFEMEFYFHFLMCFSYIPCLSVALKYFIIFYNTHWMGLVYYNIFSNSIHLKPFELNPFSTIVNYIKSMQLSSSWHAIMA